VEVKIMITAKDKEEDAKAEREEEGKEETEEEGKTEKRGWLCIRKTMWHRILHEAHDNPAGRHFGADRMYIRLKVRFFWKQLLPDTQCYVAG
jgi:hypothetical protein